MTIVKAVDQMQVPGAAASGTDRQPSCEMRLRSSGIVDLPDACFSENVQ